MTISPTALLTRFNGFSIGAKLVTGLAVALLVLGLVVRFSEGVHQMIFGNTEAQREHGNAVVAQEQTTAEANIADKTIQTVHERDVYREHITNVVHDGQERVNAVDKGQQMDPDIDAAVAAGLCGVHDSLCRSAPSAAVQQVCRPVPGQDGAC